MLVVLLIVKLGIAVKVAYRGDALAPRDWPRIQCITIFGTLSRAGHD
jgi:hypothetical protein